MGVHPHIRVWGHFGQVPEPTRGNEFVTIIGVTDRRDQVIQCAPGRLRNRSRSVGDRHSCIVTPHTPLPERERETCSGRGGPDIIGPIGTLVPVHATSTVHAADGAAPTSVPPISDSKTFSRAFADIKTGFAAKEL